MADKLDINEELVRMNDHLEKLKMLMEREGADGTKAGFSSHRSCSGDQYTASKSNNLKYHTWLLILKPYR